MSKFITNDQLKEIYGTLEDIEELCRDSSDCWRGIEHRKYKNKPKPYKPYVGCDYKGIFFCGTNLNGGNESLDAIDGAVSHAINDYLKDGKYKIFKQESYGGSPFYYYVPLISFLFSSYLTHQKRFDDESAVSNEQIVEGFRYCALSNLIKCSVNSPNGRSKPSEAMHRNCIPKLRQELNLIPYRILVTFTYYWGSDFAKNALGNYTLLTEGNKHRIQRQHDRYLLELEHPLSTKKGSTRAEKFRAYSNAIYDVVDLMATEKIIV